VAFKHRNLEAIGALLVGNLGRNDPDNQEEARYFPYRSSSHLTEFFQELDTEYDPYGLTRHRWVADVLADAGRSTQRPYSPAGRSPATKRHTPGGTQLT